MVIGPSPYGYWAESVWLLGEVHMAIGLSPCRYWTKSM